MNSSKFLIIFGDEIYINNNFDEFMRKMDYSFDVVCSVMETEDIPKIKNNYLVKTENGRITRITEKPSAVDGALFGCGLMMLSRKVFKYISKGKTRVFMEVIDEMAKDGLAGFFPLKGDYFNINTREDYLSAVESFERWKRLV
jgi:NDP-sugar pyrophosphorylase family protein